MDREIFKSKKFTLLFSALSTLLMLVFLKLVFNDTSIYLEFSLLIPLGLFFGPLGVLGFIIVEVFNAVIGYAVYNPLVLLIDVIIAFVLGLLPWKLWYTVMQKDGFEVPNMNNFYNLIKFVLIVLISAFQLLAFTNIDNRGIHNLANEGLVFFIYLYYIIISIIIIYVASRFDIPAYTPSKQFKKFMPDKLYVILFLFSLLIEVYIFVTDYEGDFLILFSLFLTCIYLIRPFKEDVFKIDNSVNKNIFFNFLISIMLMLIALILLISVSVFLAGFNINHSINIYSFFNLYIEVAFNIFLAVVLPLLIYMYFLEKQVLKPVEDLSTYLDVSEDYADYDDFRNNLNSIDVKNELKNLANSLVDMEDELLEYRDELIDLTRETERFKTELRLAHNIQYSMIPDDFNEFSENRNFTLWGNMESAHEVCGDFYDYFEIDDDNIGFVIGDVAGKGVYAALICVGTMTLIQDFGKKFVNPSDVFYHVNNILHEAEYDEELFVACLFGVFNTKTGEISYANAGIDYPLIQNDEGRFEYLNTDSDMILAKNKDESYTTHSITLKENNSIFLYTNGVIEARNDNDEFYGKQRLKNTLEKHGEDDLEELISSIEKDIAEFRANREILDDATMFVLRRN